MVFLTACFGKPYVQVGKGLVRSLRAFSPKTDIHVVANLDGIPGYIKRRAWDLYHGNGPFYSYGQRKNVFKFNLIEELQRKFPGETICWIDADTLVLDELSNHLRDGELNVLTRGSSAGTRTLATGVTIPADRFVLGGLYTIPPGPCLSEIRRIMKERPSWKEGPDHYSGDMAIMNHLVHASKFPAHFVTDDRRFIYNFDISGGDQPTVGNKHLREIRIHKDAFMLGDRKIAVFSWTMSQWLKHEVDCFSTFSKDVAEKFREFYAP